MPRSRFKIKYSVFIVLALGISLGMSRYLFSSSSALENRALSTAPATGIQPAFDLSTAITGVAKENIPSVVHIEVTQRQEISNPLMPFENDPLFRYFFNAPRQLPKKFKQEQKGIGSGMLIDPEGHILTNNHVVAGASLIEVLLTDGNRYTAKVIGVDPKTDLAVIQIKADGTLPHVTFGDSDKMEVGNWVVAIGHPRGLDQTVTHGIISAKHRRGILDPNSYQDYLQTDAAINPGNSGGPLLNLEGKVIGVNAAIFSESGGFEGIGFAIPSNMAVYIAQALINHGKVERGWLGITIQELTPDVDQSDETEYFQRRTHSRRDQGGTGRYRRYPERRCGDGLSGKGNTRRISPAKRCRQYGDRPGSIADGVSGRQNTGSYGKNRKP